MQGWIPWSGSFPREMVYARPGALDRPIDLFVRYFACVFPDPPAPWIHQSSPLVLSVRPSPHETIKTIQTPPLCILPHTYRSPRSPASASFPSLHGQAFPSHLPMRPSRHPPTPQQMVASSFSNVVPSDSSSPSPRLRSSLNRASLRSLPAEDPWIPQEEDSQVGRVWVTRKWEKCGRGL